MHKHEYGEVPWDLEQLLEVFDWYLALGDRSKEDWIFREQGLAIDDSSGHTGKWSIFRPELQLENYMMDRYRDREDKGSAFLLRLHKILEFFGENEERLAAESGLCHRREDGLLEVSLAVYQSLSVIPYSRTDVEDNGLTVRKFDYEEVISHARTYPDLGFSAE